MQRIKAEKMAEILQEQQRQQRAAQNQQHGAAANSWGHWKHRSNPYAAAGQFGQYKMMQKTF